MTMTSRLLVLSNPLRWELTPVDVFYGEVRDRPERTMVLGPSGDVTRPGDIVRDKNGTVWEFLGRENSKILLGAFPEG